MSYLKFKLVCFVLCFLSLSFCLISYSQEKSDESGEYVKSVVLWYEHEFFEAQSSQYSSWSEGKLENPARIVQLLQRHFVEEAAKERKASVDTSGVQEVALNFMSYNLQIVCQNNGKIFIYAYPVGLYTKRQLMSFLPIKVSLHCDHFWYAEYDSKEGKVLNACIHIGDRQNGLDINTECKLPQHCI